MGWGCRSKYRTSHTLAILSSFFFFFCFRCILVLLARRNSGELQCPVLFFYIYGACLFQRGQTGILKYFKISDNVNTKKVDEDVKGKVKGRYNVVISLD